MTPLNLVDLLNEVFQCFDGLVEKYDLEKIKTIGDCYMVASGVPRPRVDHAVALVDLALDMQQAVAGQSFGGRRLAFRIGVNSGPVVAGVIGRKKFIYDLWGEAVNLASRMEAHGQRRTIQITRNTYELVKDAFDCQPRGIIDVKGAGPMEARDRPEASIARGFAIAWQGRRMINGKGIAPGRRLRLPQSNRIRHEPPGPLCRHP
jgi:guanylate cyclase